MPKRKDDVQRKINTVRLTEAADAVIYVLEEHDKRFPDTTLSKHLLLTRIPDAIHRMRTNARGIKYIPTVENHEVAVASGSFVRANWTVICLKCAESGYFVIWNPPGESLGIRLGTLEEYERQQSTVMLITDGIAQYHNKRSQVIDMHGGPCNDLHVKVGVHRGEQLNG